MKKIGLRHLGILALLLLAAAYVLHAAPILPVAPPRSSRTARAQTAPSAKPFANAAQTESARVIRVVDGDTVDMEEGEGKIRIRVIGIDTPEVIDPRKPVQCFGKESSVRGHELLDNADITMTRDPSQDDLDKYGRSLRFITLPDGSDYGLKMIAGGYAHEYTYRAVPYARQAEYRAAEKAAREAKRGLWADDACAGNTAKAAAKQSTANGTCAIFADNVGSPPLIPKSDACVRTKEQQHL